MVENCVLIWKQQTDISILCLQCISRVITDNELDEIENATHNTLISKGNVDICFLT
jgi:hypothetical protein